MMQQGKAKSHPDTGVSTGILAHMLALWILGSVLLYGVSLMLPLAPVLSLTGFIGVASQLPYWSVPVSVMALLLFTLLWLRRIYRCNRVTTTWQQMTLWMSATVGNSIGLGMVAMSLFIGLMQGMAALVEATEVLLVVVFAGLLFGAGAQMRYLDELAGTVKSTVYAQAEGLSHRCYRQSRNWHNALLAANLFVVTIMTTTGVSGEIGMLAALLLLVSLLGTNLLGLLLFHGMPAERERTQVRDVMVGPILLHKKYMA